MYEPKLGRFLSRDPLPQNGVELLYPFPDLTRYAYVRNNPVNLTDQSGLQELHSAASSLFRCDNATIRVRSIEFEAMCKCCDHKGRIRMDGYRCFRVGPDGNRVQPQNDPDNFFTMVMIRITQTVVCPDRTWRSDTYYHCRMPKGCFISPHLDRFIREEFVAKDYCNFSDEFCTAVGKLTCT